MTDPGGLQFDKAEQGGPSPSGTACLACKTAIADSYFTVGGQVVCLGCKGIIEAEVARGSRGGRFLKAMGVGLGAALLGTIIYALVLRLDQGFVVLTSILVGFLVGKGVRLGSGNRGGRAYQVLAVLLTYVSIASGYVPVLLEAAGKARPVRTQKKVDEATTPKDAPPAVEERSAERPGCLAFGVALAVIFGLACTLPWKIGMIGWVSVIVALVEAWRLTRGTPLVFSGPFRVGGQPVA